MSAIALGEPTSPPVIRWSLAMLGRRIDRLNEAVEERLVEAASEALDEGVNPFEVVERVQVTARHPLGAAVAVSVVAAASRAAFLGRAAGRDWIDRDAWWELISDGRSQQRRGGRPKVGIK